MSTVVCDASPLIFLAKLGRLNLIRALLGEDVVILRCVVDEVLGPDLIASSERQRLCDFVGGVEVVDFDETTHHSARLSASDASTLTYAVTRRVNWLVADERLLRRIAEHEGIPTMGTLGLLVAASKRGLISPTEALHDLDAAVSRHHLRISAALYREVRGRLTAEAG